MVKVIENKRKRFARFCREVCDFARKKWLEFWNPKPDIEVNEEVKKMSGFITENYSPKDQVKLIKGLKSGTLSYLLAEATAAEKRAKDCRDAIVLISKI